MSVLANNFKMKFAGLLRGLLRRVDGSEDSGLHLAHPAMTPPPLPNGVAPITHAPVNDTPVAPLPPQPTVAAMMDMATPASEGNVAEVEMPLMQILEKLPPDLRSKWIIGGTNLSQACICISVEKILPQLSEGAVKIAFGELRAAAPGLFRTGEEYDSLPITLPLNEVLARLNPALLTRKSGQKAVTAPPEISGPFGAGAKGVAFATTLLKPTPSTTHFLRKTVAPVEPIKMPMPMPIAPPPSFSQRSITPASSAPTLPASPRVNRPAQMPPTPVPVQPPITPITPIAPITPISPIATTPFVKPAAPAVPTTPAATPAPLPEGPTIPAPLAALSESWPETLRLEIVQLNLQRAQVALPVQLIEPALRRGRVVFPWKQLRSWIRPGAPGASAHDATELELPLKILAPLFIPRQKTEPKPRMKPTLPPSSVPNLFFGFPQPQPEELAPPINAPEAVPIVKPLNAKAAETDYYVWGDGKEAPRTDETDYKRPIMPGTDFSSRRATPNEIIEKAMKLPGMVGAVVALPDGLKVACQLPPELNPDTVAAFLPQLFSRVSQCSKELRMGELNNLNFTIGNVPWKIFRVNAVYFAAFGRAGEPLPTAQLAQLAAELDRKK